MSEVKYSHRPSGDTAGWAKFDRVSLDSGTICGLPHEASERDERIICAYLG